MSQPKPLTIKVIAEGIVELFDYEGRDLPESFNGETLEEVVKDLVNAFDRPYDTSTDFIYVSEGEVHEYLRTQIVFA
jgi:hypothetical protein